MINTKEKKIHFLPSKIKRGEEQVNDWIKENINKKYSLHDNLTDYGTYLQEEVCQEGGFTAEEYEAITGFAIPHSESDWYRGVVCSEKTGYKPRICWFIPVGNMYRGNKSYVDPKLITVLYRKVNEKIKPLVPAPWNAAEALIYNAVRKICDGSKLGKWDEPISPAKEKEVEKYIAKAVENDPTIVGNTDLILNAVFNKLKKENYFPERKKLY